MKGKTVVSKAKKSAAPSKKTPAAVVAAGASKGDVAESYPKNYTPSEKEPYMNPKQLAYFRDMLFKWRNELIEESEETRKELQEYSSIEADPNDQATIEYEQTVELRTRDRERKLISKIDEALDRIKTGDYGYCEETGDPIGIPRLLARPTATLCIEAKRRQEKQEVGYAGWCMVSKDAPHPDVDPKLLEVLVCPVTKGALVYDKKAQELISRAAKLAYPIRDGVPVMLAEEARRLKSGEEKK